MPSGLKSPATFFNLLLLSSFVPYLAIIPIFPETIFGLKYTSLSWMLMFLICIPYLVNISKPTFPFIFYIPYFLYILSWVVITPTFNAIQFTIQPLTPILIGVIGSSFFYNNQILKNIFRSYLVFLSILAVIILLQTISSGYVPLAPSFVMSACIFGSIFLSIWFIRQKISSILSYFFLVFITVFSVMRMGTLMILTLWPLHALNKSLLQRILAILGIVIIGSIIFLSPSFQRKMFYSGEGSVKDISFDNPDFNTSGRNTLKLIVEQDLEESPTFGKGPRADIALYGYFNYKKAILHNDYLLLRHSYGYTGLFLYLGALLFQLISLFRLKTKVQNTNYVILWGAAVTLFIPYLGFMYSDNIYLYGPFYSHFHFAMIGIIYSMSKKKVPTFPVEPATEGTFTKSCQ